jgi:hypothetical protein
MPWLAIVSARRVLGLDRLPILRERESKRLTGLPAALSVLFQSIRRLGQPSTAPTTGPLRQNGIQIWHLPPEDRHFVHQAVAKPLDELSDRLRSRRASVYEDGQKWLDRTAYPDVYRAVEEQFAKLGVLREASAYLGRPAAVIQLMVQINDQGNEFFFHAFTDCGLPDPPTHLLHYDTTYGVLKSMIYLSEVKQENGPFCYVLGSHRLQPRGFDGLVRRAVDRSGLAQLDPESRRLFLALPVFLRKKASFGSDCLPDSAVTRQLMASEYQWTSQDGEVALFDNLGLHRGGLVREGERRVLFAIIS